MSIRHGYCKQCGVEFEQIGKGGPTRKFCSDECCYQWWKEHPEKKKSYVYICENCGREYVAKQKNRDTCCSLECAWKLASKRALVEKKCRSCGRAFMAPLSGSDYCSDECYERGMQHVCAVCGTVFYGHSLQKYCKECKLEAGRRKYEEYMAEQIGNRAYTCLECGRQFIAPYGDKRHKFCTDACRRRYHGRIHKRTRRALKKSNGRVERIDPLAIYERDNWRCGICGGKVNPNFEYPHPRSASLDHIIPLSWGGMHISGNVQCAHLGCNIEKRDIGKEEWQRVVRTLRKRGLYREVDRTALARYCYAYGQWVQAEQQLSNRGNG